MSPGSAGEPSELTRLLVLAEQAGLRLDQFLAAVTQLSRRRARVLIGDGRVRIGGRPVRLQSRRVRRGEVVEAELTAEEAADGAGPEPPPLVFVHRDRWLVVVDKPSGVLCQPAERRRRGELALDERLVLELVRQEGGQPRLHPIHRLDRGASGLVVFARSRETAAALSASFESGRAERRYRAVVEGRPDFARRILEAPIARVRGGAWRFEVAARGRSATTEVEVERVGRDWAMLRCRLLSGRTHQVRVHLAWVGHPVLGDRLYGCRAAAVPRLLLHAEELDLTHPASGEPLHLISPPPADFAPYLRPSRDRPSPAPREAG